MGLQLTGLYRYPLKSARGTALQSVALDRFGIAGDRRWMLVDDAGRFVSQRSLPALARLAVTLDALGLALGIDDESLFVAVPGPAAPVIEVEVWGDRLPARLAADEAAHWLTRRLGTPLRMVWMPDDAQRAVDPAFAGQGHCVSFADGFPLLLISQAALEELNRRLPAPVPMDRFRPNLVIGGAAPHAEDQWRKLRIGAVEIELVKPCTRCVVPSIDQQTARRDPAINRVLAAYRRRDGAITFGMNGVAAAGGILQVGDDVALLH
jgi:uncharacterized protein YcbX